MCYWCYIFYYYNVDHISMYWIPFSGIIGLIISHYIDKDMYALDNEVNKLINAKYNYKKL